MAELYSVAGSHFYIGSASMQPASNLVAASFSAVTWIEVGKFMTMGPMGEESAAIDVELINESIHQIIPGTDQPPALDMGFGNDPSDVGQVAMIAARAAKVNYPFKIAWPLKAGQITPYLRLFVGVVLTAREDAGGPNSIIQFVGNVRRNSNLVRVAAT